MTLRGYSTVLERTVPLASLTANAEERDPTRAPENRGSTRRQWQLGDPGPRPSSLAARQALGGVTNATLGVDQQLALVEMLIAVGPEVREQGTFQEALRVLKDLEDELGKTVAELLRACSDLRAHGASVLSDDR